MNEPVRLNLKPRMEKRLRGGHVWVYSNEVDTQATPLKGLQPGSLVDIYASRGHFQGRGTVNPATLIAVRLLTHSPVDIDSAFFEQRFQQALALREALYDSPFYRLVHSEGDALPGLVVDRFADLLVVEVNTVGMESLRPLWEPALRKVTGATQIIFKRNSSGRQLEGLPTDEPDSAAHIVTVPENGLALHCDVQGGQKTGWFYDQKPHRELFARLAKDQDVLDVFSYVGGWGLGAAAHGARSVTCVDASAAALGQLQATADHAGLTVESICGDALEKLRSLRDSERKFGLIVVDPPALIKRKKDFEAGREHYARLNHVALQTLAPGGILFASSCSHHMPAETLLGLVQREAARLGRSLQLFHSGGAGFDHPVHPAMPETAYLKTFAFRAL